MSARRVLEELKAQVGDLPWHVANVDTEPDDEGFRNFALLGIGNEAGVYIYNGPDDQVRVEFMTKDHLDTYIEKATFSAGCEADAIASFLQCVLDDLGALS